MSAYDVCSILDKYNKIIAWGAGGYFEYYHRLLEGKITYIVDRNVDLHGKKKVGIPIKPLAELEREQNKKECLIVVFNAQFDEIFAESQALGTFDIIDIKTIEALYERICGAEYHNYSEEGQLPVLICAGMHAMWEINGSRKFIDSQNGVLHRKGFNTLEVIPLKYYEECSCLKQYVAVSLNGKNWGILMIEDFIVQFSRVNSAIIHSLYYSHEILKILLEGIMVQKGILYYLHDYYCVCNNRFLYYQNKACLDQHNKLCCSRCNNRNEQKNIYEFHQNLFDKYNVKLIAPSQHTAMLVHQVYKNVETIVIPHLSFEETEYNKPHKKVERVAYIGGANRSKGWDEFKCIFGQLKNLYKFYCMGMYGKNDYIEEITYENVAIEQGKETLTMAEALKKNNIDIVFLGAIWPETFSYTYYEAFEAGCFVITNELSGNICNQVKVNQNGIILKNTADIIQWLSDKENVSNIVAKMNRKISEVKADESFLEYIKE
ncbi:MAG: glycosyltransferase family 4 protein [Lachnospiraceae bacterium]|nr:glycosyltransferase family 4 protein [Lachnospiraceae bacterium]